MAPLAELAVLVISGAAAYALLIILFMRKEAAGLLSGTVGREKP